jgi:hypothetical protein
MKVIGKIQRVRGLAPEAFHRDFVLPERPVVLEGAAETWPAVRRWTADALKERIGAFPTRFKSSPSHRHPDFRADTLAATFATRTGTFREFLELIGGDTGARHLLTGEEEFLLRRRRGNPDERNEKLATLLDDFPLPPFFSESALYSSWFWLSSRGVRTWLHYDTNGCHNLNAQIQGRKRVWLFDPDWLSHVYPFPLGGSVPAHNCSRVDFEAPDAEFPGFASAECVEGELEAGDILFLPVNWIHTFLHEGRFNANVNFWWKPSTIRTTKTSTRQTLLDQVAALGGFRSLEPSAQKAFAEIDRRLIDGEL